MCSNLILIDFTKINLFNEKLQNWFNSKGREFDWRYKNNPYIVLVSEIMLQKTDAFKVSKVFTKFIERFPTIVDLSSSSVEEIADIIKPLGLSYRAIRLKKIADQIVNDFNKNIPECKEELITLNGVGKYISNAIQCFAFKKKVPIVDTNIIRICKRIFNVRSSKSRSQTDAEIWNFANSMLPEENYINYNYALLDFASIVCKAKKPLCRSCIMKNICEYVKVKKNECKSHKIYSRAG